MFVYRYKYVDVVARSCYMDSVKTLFQTLLFISFLSQSISLNLQCISINIHGTFPTPKILVWVMHLKFRQDHSFLRLSRVYIPLEDPGGVQACPDTRPFD